MKSARREASALLAVESPEVLALIGADAAWWICHDEGGVGAMVSLVRLEGDTWSTRAVDLTSAGGNRTDAEALARVGNTVFVFGSSFAGKAGSFDDRRAFIARFSEAAATAGTATAEVLDLGTTLLDMVLSALQPFALLENDEDQNLVNIEGAVVVGGDLILGLRWPVSAGGQPILVRLMNAVSVISDPMWTTEALRQLEVTSVVVDVDASAKRPAGVRGMAAVNNSVHLVTGQTERGLTAKKVKAAPAIHVKVEGGFDGANAVGTEIERFEGFRKVEGLAPMPNGGWLYALDDEDAVVLLVNQSPD